MKSVLLSVRPQWVAKILNKEKTIEVRKKFPTDYVGWVYIYCTKGEQTLFPSVADDDIEETRYELLGKEDKDAIVTDTLNGNVVARFWCNKVEEIVYSEEDCEWKTKSLCFEELLNKSLTHDCLLEYLGDNGGYAIHITKLEIFDKPKEISEFKVKGFERIKVMGSPYDDFDYVTFHYEKRKVLKPLTRAPQSWGYIEI